MASTFSERNQGYFKLFPFDYGPLSNANVNLLLLKMLQKHKVSIP